MDYFVAESNVAFHEAIQEAFQRAAEQLPEPETPFGELCPYHKDNTYAVVPPPEEGDSDDMDDDGGI